MKELRTYLLLLTLLSGIGCACAQNMVVVNKKELKVYVIGAQADTLCSFPCACGKMLGNKRSLGDYCTPEGVFTVAAVENSKYWKYKGIPHVYGPYFIRLNTYKWDGIGIHGTNSPKSIGTRCTKGCIRLNNRDIVQLVKYVDVGTPVRVMGDYSDHRRK